MLGEPSGFAEVYRYPLPAPEFGLDAGTLVAVKVYHDHVAARPEEIERFRDEVRLGSEVRHPNVVELLAFDFDEDAAKYYCVMKYLEGQTLKSWRLACDERDLSDAALSAITAGLIEGLEALHAKGLVHRDLKPANVMLVPRGDAVEPVVLDLGLAVRLSDASLTNTGEVLAATRYSAPEYLAHQHRRDYDSRVDLYSLGAVLFFLLSGTHPYPECRDAFAVKQASLDAYPVSLEPVPSGVSHWWKGVAYGLMCKDPDRRASLAEVAWMIARLANDQAPLLEEWQYDSSAKYWFHSIHCRLLDVPRVAGDDAYRAPARMVLLGRHLDTVVASCRSAGVRKRALYQHPYYEEGNPQVDEGPFYLPETVVRYVLEGVSGARYLEFYTGIKDGGDTERTKDKPVRFAVRVNGETLFDELRVSNGWARHLVPIPPQVQHSIIQVDLITQAIGTPASAWAVWGEPQLVG